jgi:triacylglycerol lipase
MNERLANDIAGEIRGMGNAFNLDVLRATYELFTPLQERAPKDGVEIERDLAYGEDERHRLDIFTPAQRPAMPAPVVVYVHGGGFIAGERSPIPGLIYDNVPTFFARHGLIGVNATYRLAPDHKWPSGAADAGAVVAWLKANVARYGGDPARIFLMGQSAGATHVATYAFFEEVHGAPGPGIAGAILLSGSYAPLGPNSASTNPGENQIAYYGEDLDAWVDRSPLYQVKPGHPPIYIGVAEFDPYPLMWPSAALLEELVKCDKTMPWFKQLRGHNHVSPAMHVNSEIDILGPDLLDFIAQIA